MHVCVPVCVCMCVYTGETETERQTHTHIERMIKANKVNVNVWGIWVKDLQ